MKVYGTKVAVELPFIWLHEQATLVKTFLTTTRAEKADWDTTPGSGEHQYSLENLTSE